MQQPLAPTRIAPAPGKAIPPARDRFQSRWLVRIVGTLLVASVGLATFTVVGMSGPPLWFLVSLAVSVAFALLVFRLRAATASASALGGLICLKALLKLSTGVPWTHTVLPELIALFLLTFAATRFARRRTHAASDPRELRHGRTAAQVIANLGVAAHYAPALDGPFVVIALAALAEATADTVASELGQALQSPAFLLTSLRRVPPGTDGAISLAGTALGLAAAALLAAIPVALGAADPTSGVVIFLGGTAGLFFDSLLGATLERRGWIGNDLVNFLSTLFAAAVALQLIRFLDPPIPFW